MDTTLVRTLREVSGYLTLGMPEEAAEALDTLPPAAEDHPGVMVARIEVGLAAERWDAAALAAGKLTERIDDQPQHWIWWAYATRRAESVAAAEAILERALEHHPEVALLHYNLACYAAVQGRPDEARRRLGKAAELDPGVRLMAGQDPDLQCLRGSGPDSP